LQPGSGLQEDDARLNLLNGGGELPMRPWTGLIRFMGEGRREAEDQYDRTERGTDNALLLHDEAHDPPPET
jgi:hypothetical protein